MQVLRRGEGTEPRSGLQALPYAAAIVVVVTASLGLAGSAGLGSVLAAAGLGAGFAAASSLGMRFMRRRLAVPFAARLVDCDPGLAVLADAQGRVVARSPRVSEISDVATVQDVLAPCLADADGVIAALLARSDAEGCACHAGGAGGSRVEVSVQAVGTGHRLWRVTRNPSVEPEHAIPTVVLAPGGTILWRNAAAVSAIGSELTHLDTGADSNRTGSFKLDTGDWSGREVRLHEIAMEGGVRQVCLIPVEVASAAPSDRDVLGSLPIPILRLAPGGIVEEGNRHAADLLGHDLSGGVALDDLVDGLGRGVGHWIDAAFGGAGLGHPETVQVVHAETETHVRITLSRVVTVDGPRVIAVMNDATELKTLEAQFVQSQKMQAIGQLAGGIAHDFNNILTAISGYCDLLRLRDTLAAEDRGDLNHISQNTQRAAAIVNQLLAFSRKQKLKPEPLDLRGTLSDLTHLLAQLAGAKVGIEYDHGVDLPPIRGDSRQIGQVLMNLVINARDAMGEEGGTVAITTRSRLLQAPVDMGAVEVPAGRYVTVEVADGGSGIPPDILPRIFEPFYTTKEQGKGTGLGLSTVYGIVKQSGGYVFAEARAEGGTAFTLWFPALKDIPAIAGGGAADGTTPLPKVGGAQANRTVLLCEDEAPVRAIAARALGLRGFDVIEADCGEAALAVLDRHGRAPDVLLTDVVMPGLDGPAWVGEALRVHPATPVIFMSGYTEGTLDGLRTNHPEARLLPKPFSLDDLISVVEDVVPR